MELKLCRGKHITHSVVGVEHKGCAINRDFKCLQLPTCREICWVDGKEAVHERIWLSCYVGTGWVIGIHIHKSTSHVFNDEQVAQIVRMNPLITGPSQDTVERVHGRREIHADFDDTAVSTVFLCEQQGIGEWVESGSVNGIEMGQATSIDGR